MSWIEDPTPDDWRYFNEHGTMPPLPQLSARRDSAAWQTPWHRRLARLGGAMVRVGWSPHAVRAALIEENSNGGVARSDDKDVRDLARWLTDIDEGDPAPAPWATDTADYVLGWTRAARLSSAAGRVLLALASRASVRGAVTISVRRLAELVDRGPTAVKAALTQLEGAGAITRSSAATISRTGRRGLQATNSYQLHAISPDLGEM